MSVWEALFHPRSSDDSLLARFYRANIELSAVSDDINKTPSHSDERRLREALQAFRKARLDLMNLILKIMDYYIPEKRHKREFRMKFPDEVIENGLEAQIWYGAECLAGGNIIPTREAETESLRPMARQLVDAMQELRNLLHRDACSFMRPARVSEDTFKAMERTDGVLADFELSYVSVLVSVKSLTEMDQLQTLATFFCHVAQWAVDEGLLGLEHIEDADPATLIALPRIVVYAGLVVFPDSPLSPAAYNCVVPHLRMHAMFRRFHRQLRRLQESLQKASDGDLQALLHEITSVAHQGKMIEAQPELLVAEEEEEEEAEDDNRSRVAASVSSSSISDEEQSYSDSAPTSGFQLDRPAAFKMIAMIADCQASNAAWEMRFLLRAVYRVLTAPPPTHCGDSLDIVQTTLPPPTQQQQDTSSDTTEVATDALQWWQEEQDLQRSDRGAAEWVPDSDHSKCMFCKVPFTLFRRRHHCRACGRLLCAACTPHQRIVTAVDRNRPVRVCNYCVIFRLPPDSLHSFSAS